METEREPVVQVALRQARYEQLRALSIEERRSIRTTADILLGEALAARREGRGRGK